jgi:hypothetical protein
MKNDLVQLIDQLESLVVHGRRVPLSVMVMIEEHSFIELIDRLRMGIEEETKDARRVSSERDRVLSHAQAEADKILREAEEQAARMLAETDVVQVAHARARMIVEDAEQRAAELRRSSDSYVLEALSGLDDELSRLLAQIRRGRAMLDRPHDGAVAASVKGDGLADDVE